MLGIYEDKYGGTDVGNAIMRPFALYAGRVCEGSWVRWHSPALSALGKQMLDNQEFQVILGYLVSSRLAWATWDLAKLNPKGKNKWIYEE